MHGTQIFVSLIGPATFVFKGENHMLSLKGKNIYLRALEPEDLDFLYKLENDISIWEISGTQKPYSKATLIDYLSNAHLDIFEVKQLRLCICKHQR